MNYFFLDGRSMTSCSSEHHTKELQRFCRDCAGKIKKYKHICSANSFLLVPLGIQVANDHANVHPPHYCHNCHNIAKRLEKGNRAHSTPTHGVLTAMSVSYAQQLHHFTVEEERERLPKTRAAKQG